MILFNWHPPKWFIYVAIAVSIVLLALFISHSLTSISIGYNRMQQNKLKKAEQEKAQTIDSLTTIIEVEKVNTELKTESLQHRLKDIQYKSAIDRKILFTKYEKALQVVDSLHDDSIAVLYERCRTRHDSLFR